ncbi:uncharacterized protein PV07_08500 [Cladophialophora immunda]|uniref:Nephrocystin 3-like N-terminal domain-containing protein n=1 Tax=Cladophialophora immunda TaxID=569365 RepID=A0A0D2C217_9EURO|nr:uncharacterized protein PV07_08500 [Cladophialophora immunda]KIW25313.1 hypothetical protein PV07_08500 [Cladophialophora immunda]
MGCIFSSSLICQIITGWPLTGEGQPHISHTFNESTLGWVRAPLSYFAALEDIASVLRLVLSQAVEPTILFLDRVDDLNGFELNTLVTELQNLSLPFDKTSGVVLSGRYSEGTMKHFGDFPQVDHLLEYRADVLQSVPNRYASDEINVRRDQADDAAKGSNEWTWNQLSYRGFAAHGASLLWIEGKAGSGKSVLAKCVVTHLRSNHVQGEVTALIKCLSKTYKELALQHYLGLAKEAATVRRVSGAKNKVVPLNDSSLLTAELPRTPKETEQETQAMTGVINFFDRKTLLPCASQMLHGQENLSGFHGE